MSENKIVVNASGEKLLIGKNVIQLKDETRMTFKTNSLLSLRDFLEDEEADIFCSLNVIDVYLSKELQNIKYKVIPIATCNLKFSPQVELLKNANNKAFTLQAFIELMKAVKKYSTNDTLHLLDNLNDLKIKKIIDIQCQSDKRGNFLLNIKAEKAGSSDYEFPETVKFEVPLFDCQDGLMIEVGFDLNFTWSFQENNATLEFKISNHSLNIELDAAIQKNAKQILSELGTCVLYFGSAAITRQTDDYLYKESNIQF